MMTNLLFNRLTAIGNRLAMVLTMFVVVGIGQAWGATTNYTFTSEKWADSSNGWTSGKDGVAYLNSGVQVTEKGTGAYATSKTSFTNISKIDVKYCTNVSKGAGTIVLTVGSTSKTLTISKNGGTTMRTISASFDPNVSGTVKITVNCTTNSIYVGGITITTEDATCTEPKITFSNGSYTVGGSVLDLSTLFTSNSNGAVTYSVANANGTGAAISGTNFTATAAGSATVTATQAAKGSYCDGSATATITVNKQQTSITLSEAGSTINPSGTFCVGDSYTLPSSTAECGDKTFVGWSKEEIQNETDNPTATIYPAETTVTLDKNNTFYAVFAESGGAGTTSWVKTDIANIEASDKVVITMNNGATEWALNSSNGTYAAPVATVITQQDFKTEVADALLWNIQKDGNNLTIYPNGTTSKWLYCTDANNGVRVGDNTNKTFTIDATSGYLKHTATSRYVGVYVTNPDWRCYTSTTGNIANQTLAFYKKTTTGGYQNYTTECSAPSEYTVTFNANGHGTAPDTQTVESGQKATEPTPAPTATGYIFGGWYKESECTNKFDFNTSITADITLYAKWTAIQTTITLNANGGSGNTTSVVATYDSSTLNPSSITNPTKTGHTFDGWYSGEGGTGSLVINSSGNLQANVSGFTGTNGVWQATTNKTLYAKWTPAVYAINYKDQGGAKFSGQHEAGYPQNHTYNTETTLKSASKDHYTFDGWYKESNCSGTKVTTLGATEYTDNITLYAKWTAKTYTITFNAGTGECGTGSATTTNADGVTLPTATHTCTGWAFAGWWTEEVSSTNTSPGTLLNAGDTYNPTSDITLYAVYTQTETIQGDEDELSQTLKYDSWSYTGSTTDKSSYRMFHTGSYIESATFDLSTLTKVVVYGGTFGGDKYNSLTIGDGTNIWKTVTVTGNSQTGANSFTGGNALSGNGKLRITSNSGTASTSTGVRISRIEIYTISSITTTTYNSNPTCDICKNILIINKGAETNGTFTLSKSGEIETCDGDVVVTVSEISPAEHYSVSAVTATPPTSGEAPTVTDNDDGTWTVTYAQNSTGESTINVTFVEDAKATITLSELSVSSTIDTYYVGEQYTLPTTSSQSCDGKQLVGWSRVEVAETDTKPTEKYYERGAEVTLEAEQTFYAVFATSEEGGGDDTDYSNVHTSNVALGNTGGTNATDSKVNIGGKDYTAVKAGTGSAMGAVNITVPSGTTKLSFHMAGWNGEGNKTISLSGATADPSSFKTVADAGVSGNSTTYTLSGTIAEYFYSTTLSNINTETTLTFSNGGADQRFVIWGVNASTGGGVSYTAYTTSCVPTYSITYDFAGGTSSHCSNTSVPQDDTYTICDEAPTREGYTFQGWSDGTSTYAAGATITPTSNITLTAVWQINTYTVTWSNNGVTTPVTYEHGDDLTLPSAPASCDGVKEFVGWTEDNTFTYHATTPPSDIFTEKTATVTANATYYAVFATKGEGSANFVLGESGTFKMYANVNGTNYYAQGGVSSSKITSTTEAANASDYTLTHKGSNQYTIQLGNAYIGHSGTSSTDLNTTETTWTIKEGINGSWRIVSPVNTSRALAYRASTYKIFKAYSMTSVEAGDIEYYDIEFGGVSSGYSDYTTTCQQIESIEVQNPQTEFYITDDFTIGSGKVIATLSGGGTTDVTTLATFSGYNMNEVGTYTVTVTYMGATATYEINVKPLDNAWVLTWNVSGKTNTGLGPRYVNKGSAIGTLPTPVVPDACEGKTFMGWTESNIVNSDGSGITYITSETVPTDNTTYYAVFATVNNFCTQKPIDQITSGSKVVIVAVASLTDDGGAGKAISSRATDDTYNLQGDDVAIYDQTINTPHSTCIWTITKSGDKYIFTQDGKYLNGIIDGIYSNLKYNSTSDSWSLSDAASGMAMTYNMKSTNASTEYVEWYNGKFTIHNEVNDNGNFDMQFYVTANKDGNADITDYTTGCEEYTITYYGFRGGYSTSTSSDGIIVLPVNSMHTVPDCGDVVTDHTNLGREFLNVWMTQPHGGHTFEPGDTFILTQDTTLYAQWKMETTSDVTTLPTDIEDLAGTDVYVYGGKTLNIQPGTTTINSLTLKGGLQSDGSYKMPIVWVPEGATLVRNSNKIYLDLKVNAKNYYPFAVPFATKNDQYIDYLDPKLNAASTYDKHFVIKTYNGALRATNGEDRANNWVKVNRHATDKPSYLQPGVGYIIQALTYPDKDTATIRIPMTVPNTWFENGEQAVVGTTVRNTIAVTAHTGAAATEHQRHAGWNFVANPYLSNFTGGGIDATNGLDYIDGELTVNGGWLYGGDNVPYVTIPAYDFSYYTQHKLSDVKLSPEWSFFVQIGTGGTMDFSTAGRQETPASIAARHDAAQSFKMDVDITLSDKNHSDQMGLIICDRFSSAYEVGYDLEKMFGSAYNLTVYTLMEDNTPLAYHALAIHSNMQVIPVGYRVPEQGDYTFALNQSTSSIDLLNEQYEQLILVDYETGALTNLLNSSYTFTSPRTQSDSRFAIYAVIRQKTPTDLPNIDDGDTSTRKILHNGHLYILRDGKVYNGNGQIVK